MTINRTVAFGIILLGAFVVTALSLALVSLRETQVNPVGGSVSRPTPPPPEPRIFSGNFLSITPEKQEITIGTYRVENNRAVLASQQVIHFTAETAFVRQAADGKEASIRPEDVRLNDPVTILAPPTQGTGAVIAQRVIILNIPPPPRL